MSQIIEVKVPDIGDFKDVPVIEVAVKVGDAVKAEDALLTLESDKATMDVPSPAAGVVRELKVKVGDRVGEGAVVLTLEAAEALTPSPSPAGGRGEEAALTPNLSPAGGREELQAPAPAGAWSGTPDIECEMLVIGAGPGGYSAAFRSADLGLKTVMIERYPSLGGVCLNVGCIPSKALLHVANVIEEASHFADVGVAFDKPTVDLDRLRAHKEKVVAKLTGGLAGMARARKVEIVRGYGVFLDAHHVEVTLTTGSGSEPSHEKKVVRFAQAIIAVGSQAVKLPFLPDDPRIVDSTGALELRQVPKRMLVIGGGIIGLEMATVYSSLGARIDVVEMGDTLMAGADRDAVKVWEKQNLFRFDKVMLNTRTVGVTCRPDGILVKFEGEAAPTDDQKYDLILSAVGRSPNGKKIGAEKAGVFVSERGFIPVDKQQRTNVPHIFAIGDVVGQPMLAHKGVHEAHIAAEVAAGLKSWFDATIIPSVAYTEPEVAWVGVTETEARATGRRINLAKFPWTASGRAIANGCDYGFTKLIFDDETHRVVGGCIVGPNAGDMIGEISLAVEMGCDAVDIGKTIHPHPTLGESIGMTAEVFEGICTDLPPSRKK